MKNVVSHRLTYMTSTGNCTRSPLRSGFTCQKCGSNRVFQAPVRRQCTSCDVFIWRLVSEGAKNAGIFTVRLPWWCSEITPRYHPTTLPRKRKSPGHYHVSAAAWRNPENPFINPACRAGAKSQRIPLPNYWPNAKKVWMIGLPSLLLFLVRPVTWVWN